jgi:hypothetical protein
VADIAPQFALPGADGKLWSSRDQLGKHAMFCCWTVIIRRCCL